MRSLHTSCLCLALFAVSGLSSAEEFAFKIPVTQQSSGSYHVSGSVEESGEVEFLIDTGAGMVILAEKTFRSLNKVSNRKPSKRIAVRMADGRSKAVNVYTVTQLVLGDECNVGPLEVAVIPGATKNILGMDVLNKAAPFAIYNSPPSLALSACAQVVSGLAKADAIDTESPLLRLLSGNLD